MEIDGKEIHQSTSIARYLGKEADLAGSDNWEALQIDMAVDTLHDFRMGNDQSTNLYLLIQNLDFFFLNNYLFPALVGYFFETDKDAREKKRDPLLNNTVPFYLSKFDELVKQNNGYLANEKVFLNGNIYTIILIVYTRLDQI